MNVLLKILIVLGFLFINGVRGGRFGAPKLPGHPRFWVSPLVAPLAWLAAYPIMEAVTLAAAYLAWSFPPWGRWFTLNRLPRDLGGRRVSLYESVIESISDVGGKRRDHVAFFLRHLSVLAPLSFLPLFHLVSTTVGAALIVCIYELSWRFSSKGAEIRNAELATGVLFGLALVTGAT